MRILVGTLLANAERASKQWLALQLAALRATVDFEHVAIIPPSPRVRGHHREAIAYFSQHTKLLTEFTPPPTHADSLTILQDYFLSRVKEFDFFLFLDSDAFPVRTDWVNCLTKIMQGRHGWRHEIAALYRPEFWETRLHASVVFTWHRALQRLQFVQAKRPSKGGGREWDVYIDPYNDTWGRAHRLTRSNKINLHPMLAGIYGDIFYHHGCGSRTNRNFKGDDLWSPLIDKSHFEPHIPQTLRAELMSNPHRFISQFLWRPERCALPEQIPPPDKE